MKDHILVLRAENRQGVLAKITNLIRRRGFNIEGMTAGHTEQKNISHVTVDFSGESSFNAEQAKKQLSKIIEIISVKAVTKDTAIREIALFKIHCSESTKAAIFDATKIFEGKVVAVGKKSVVIEITGTPKRIDDFHVLVKNYGIKEFVRSSVIAVKYD